MKTQITQPVRFIVIAALAAVLTTTVFADDLNPPAYRDDPLSVFAHYEQIPGTPFLELTGYNTVDDTDPDTTLYPMAPPNIIEPETNNYEFYLPNFIDKLPIKYMRLQLTWEGSNLPPDVVGLAGSDGINPVFGNIVYSSPVTPLVDPTAVLYYQYHDIEFKPNPDQERWLVHVPDDATDNPDADGNRRYNSTIQAKSLFSIRV
jgi:hypothetical protein